MRDEIKNLEFLVIGAPKSGTTALFHYLRHHPGIFIPAQKELAFFSEEELFAQGWQKFAVPYFHGAPTNRLWGKITPEYMRHPCVVPKRLYQTMPLVKLIVLLRNPIDRAFSHYRMGLKRNWKGQSAQSFEQMVSRETSSKVDLSSHQANIITLGLYATILKAFLQYFPPEQLLVVFADDLEKSPEIVLDTILMFLGLQPGYRPDNIGKRYHEGGTKQRFPRAQNAVHKIRAIKWIWKRVPTAPRQALKFWWWTQINVVREKPASLPENIRKKLVDFYRADVHCLEELLQKKVPWSEFRALFIISALWFTSSGIFHA
jgi:hypothetical protein